MGLGFDDFQNLVMGVSRAETERSNATIDDLGKIVAEIETARRWLATRDYELAKLAIDRARRTALALARSVAG